MAIYRGAGGAGDATNDATSQAILAAQSAQEAAASEAAAASSASSAATSASNAASSATSAASSATSASNSASSATTQAANAASSAATATTKASEAATSATNAASSATSAATSATNASNSATSAASSASTATTKAAEASTSATAAAASATAAATSEANADISEANAASSATAAASSATSAAASATSATNSASTAATQATNAASSATAAATSASNAATSATSASNSATSASTSATNAANSASSASTSATNAASSATAAAASYDSFDDRYLGSKTSNPTLDNDGNALLTGALYWNSTVGEMRVYNGSAWVAAYVPAATYVAKAGDVMTGSLEVPTQASLKATTLTRASIRPSLLLDFSNTKQLDPRIAFSRPTTATYYDGKTVVKAEENLLTYSQEFDNATAWARASVTTTANTSTAPDGTTTADNLVASTVFWSIRQTLTTVSGAPYVFSVWVKSNTGSAQTFRIYGNGQSDNSADLTATTDWQRFTFSFNGNGASATHGLRNNTGLTAVDLLVWGAQLEQRSTVTAYTPTTTAPITNYIPALQTAAAGVPRFDHDPVTGESKGLLIEEQRTNLLTYSEQFDNPVWTKNANVTVTSNSTIAPDGTLSCDEFTMASTSAFPTCWESASVSANTAYTFSFYVKRGSMTNMTYRIYNVSGSSDIVSATSYYSSTNSSSFSRISVSFTTPVGCTSIRVYTLSDTSSQTAGTNVFIWGAQLEAGSFPTSYIPTVASQVTRSADSASMTGSNFSSWYRADEGTLYADFLCNSSASDRAVTFRDSANNGRVWLSSGDGAIYLNSAFQAQFSSAAGTNPAKRAITFSSNNAAGVLNGGSVGTDTSVLIPTAIDQAGIGNNAITGAYLNGTIKRIAYYPKRLSNTELQGITS